MAGLNNDIDASNSGVDYGPRIFASMGNMYTWFPHIKTEFCDQITTNNGVLRRKKKIS